MDYTQTNFGSVIFEGKTYHLTYEAQPTGCQLNRSIFDNFEDAADGEEFDFEMTAPAVDDEGNEYTVTWIFRDTKGEGGRDYDSYDYDKVHSVDQA